MPRFHRGFSPPPQAAPVYRNPPPQDNAGNAAGAAFIGGMMGGVLGSALRR